jgi:LacI family transcriptional regulator
VHRHDHRPPGATTCTRAWRYRQALTDHHIALDEILIQGGDFTETGGYQGMQALLALGALIAICEAGLRVPQDIAVVGFDDIPTARLAYPSLTTITQFQEQLGERAAELLLERLNGTAPQGGRCVELPYTLIVRESA